MTKGYNLNEIRKFVGEDQNALKQMLEIFIENAPKTLSELNRSFNEKDSSKVNYYAHKLKNSIDLLNIEKLKLVIREIENKAKDEETSDGLKPMIDIVNEVLPEIIESIKMSIPDIK